jgi:dihydroxyacid dehydratase/phosphogluconate dehydratase
MRPSARRHGDFAGCDKSLPGMLMAAARLDVASVFVYAGSILPGKVDGTEDVTIIDAFEAVGACAAGLMTREEVDLRSSARSAPARVRAAACTPPTRWPASPRRWACRLPGSAAPPAVDRRRDGFARRSGEAVVELLREGITARDIITKSRLRERHRRRDGARRLDQRGAAPAGDRARGRGRPHARGLQPDRRRCRISAT